MVTSAIQQLKTARIQRPDRARRDWFRRHPRPSRSRSIWPALRGPCSEPAGGPWCRQLVCLPPCRAIAERVRAEGSWMPARINSSSNTQWSPSSVTQFLSAVRSWSSVVRHIGTAPVPMSGDSPDRQPAGALRCTPETVVRPSTRRDDRPPGLTPSDCTGELTSFWPRRRWLKRSMTENTAPETVLPCR